MTKDASSPIGWRSPALHRLLWLAVVLGGLMLSARLGSVGLWLKYDHALVPFLVGGITWAIFQCPRPTHASRLLAFGLLLHCAVLFATWQAGVTDGQLVAGLFPYSDARGYFLDALTLLHGGKFSEFSSRRPLFPLFLAGLLDVTGADLRATLLILTIIVGLAIAFAAREVERSHGPLPGALMFLCLFMFYRRYVGSTLTEQLGLSLGCLGFCLIWRGGRVASPRLAAGGVFLLSLALNARAGAFLILPAIVAWAGLVFRDSPARRRAVGGCLIAILAGFALNGVVLSLVGIPTAAFSNFAYSLYGLVAGGDWGSALRDHPELAALGPTEQTHRIYVLAWEQMRANPPLLFRGCLRAWASFFFGRSSTWPSHFLYLSHEWADAWVTLRAEGLLALWRQHELYAIVNIAAGMIWALWLHVFWLLGGRVAWRHRRSPLGLLAALGWGGILLSVPFVPPWDADNMRAYAATLPFVVVLPAIGLFAAGAPHDEDVQPGAPPRAGVWGVVALGLLLVVLTVPVPLTFALLGRSEGAGPAAGTSRGCPTAERRLLSVTPGSVVSLVTTGAGSVGLSGNSVSLASLASRDHGNEFLDVMNMWQGLGRAGDGTMLFSAYDVDRRLALYAYASASSPPLPRARTALCGTIVQHGAIDWFRVEGIPGTQTGPGGGPVAPAGRSGQ